METAHTVFRVICPLGEAMSRMIGTISMRGYFVGIYQHIIGGILNAELHEMNQLNCDFSHCRPSRYECR